VVTADKQKVLDAITAFDGRSGDYTPRSPFEEKFISRDPATAAASRAQVVTLRFRRLWRASALRIRTERRSSS
jgi:hypothetical protein